jgi:hypothetical protein
MEHGKIKLRKADWNHEFISQMLDFPSPLSHDDLLDSLAYIDQVSVADFCKFNRIRRVGTIRYGIRILIYGSHTKTLKHL